MLLRLLSLAVLVAACEARITSQCQCDAYMKCEETLKQDISFKNCLKMCKKDAGGAVPREYPICLYQFEHLLSNTMNCTHNIVGTGCTSNESNVLTRRNFTLFEEIFRKDFEEITNKVGVSFEKLIEPAKVMNSCLLGCFYPAQNNCTRKMKCGLFMPNELRLVDNLTKCALQSDISKGIVMEMATCMRSVMHKSEDEDKEEDTE